MSSDDGARVKALLADFSQSLSSLLAEEGLLPSHALRTGLMRVRSIRGVDLELIELSNMVENVLKSLDRADTHSDPPVDMSDSEDAIQEMSQYVIVCGPPGTESIPNLSDARFDDLESIVYSRTSLGVRHLAGRAPNYKQVLSIPPKDTPPIRAEVYACSRPMWVRAAGQSMERSHSYLSTPPMSPPSSTSSSSSSSSSTEISYNISPASVPKRQGLRNHRKPPHISLDNDSLVSSTMSHESPSLISTNPFTHHDSSKHKEEDTDMEEMILDRDKEAPAPVIKSDVFMGIELESRLSDDDDDAYHTAQEADTTKNDFKTALWSPPCNDTDSLFIGQASTDESDVQQQQQQQRSGSAEEVSEMISERESSPASRSSNLESAGSSSLSRVYSDMKRDFQVNRKPLKKETTSLKKSSHKKQKKIIRLPRNDSVSDTTKTVPEEEKAASDVVKDKKVLKSCHVVLKRLDFFNQQRSGSSNKDEKDRSPPPSPPPPAPTGNKSPKMVLTRHHGNNRTSLRHKATTKVETEPVGDKLGEKDAEAAEKSPSSSTESITFSDVANDVMRDPLSQSEHHTPDRSPVPEDRISRSCGPLNRLKNEKKGRGISDAIPPIHSSDSDFESPVSCQLSLRRKKYSTDPTLLKKKRKRIENCSSGDEERPFAEKSSKKKLCFNTDSGVCDETEETHVAKIGTEESPAVKIRANRSPTISENLDDDVDDNFGIEADDSPNEIGIDSPESNDRPANNGSGSLTKKSPTLETGASENLTVKIEAGVVSSEEQEPFTLTSEKAGLKLGKHIKGPHCKGKEKARGPPPRIVKCVACGTNVDWKKQKIHGHPRLDVITCQKCFKMYNTGEFQLWDSNEIFCSLCGDGGDILLCNYCDKSFCNACVGRISGKERLKHLLEEENEIFQCYICEPAPLKTEQELYIQLKGYFRGMGNVRSKRLQKSQKYVVDSDEDGALGRGVMDADGDSENGECSNKDDSRVPEKSDKQEASSIHGRTERKRGGRRRGNASSIGPSDDDSSSSEGNSPDIGSGELSLSDSDVLEKMEAKKKNLRKKSSRGGSKNKGSSIKKEEEEEEGQKRKKERRMRANHGYNNMSHSSDEEDQGSGEGTSAGSEGGGKRSSKKRILSSTNSESAADSGGRVKRNPRQKKSRLAASLSSNSEEEQSPQKVLLFGADMRGMGDSDDDEPPARCTSTEGSDSGPVQYKMFDAPSSDGSSSDFEFSIRRKPKNKKSEQKKSFLSSSNENKSSSSETTSKRTYKTRSRRKRDELSSDDNFVPAVQLSKKGPKTRRKNINYSLLTSDSEDESGGEAGSDGEEKEALTASQEVEKGKKRRKIRKMIGDAKLASETKMAIQKEKEREERLKKRKNLMEDEDDRLVLEQDSETKEVVLEVRRDLVPSIKPHQRDGIKFLYNACVENVKRLSSGGGGTGAILAHCMGLGKTLQVIAFADALMTCKKTGIKKVLILCPVNTVFNWKIEFLKWIPYRDCEYNIYLLNETTAKARVGKIKRWFTNGGIMFMGYEMFRNLSISKRAKKKMKEEFKKYLLDPGADLVVCDEGHVMRNSKSSLSLVINQVKTRLRIVLTGTPLQNNLTEYYTMVNFVKPNLLGMPKEFKNRFVNPITNGQCRDSSPFDIRTMKQRAHVLCALLKGTVQRRDFRVLSKSLPPKKEFVLNIRLSSVQDHLYRKYLDTGRGYRCASDLFSTFAALAKVWNHPWVLKLDEQRKFEKEERVAMYGLSSTDDETLGGFIVSGSEDEVEERKGKITRKEHIKRNLRGVSATSSSASGFSQPVTPFNANPTDGPIIISSDEELLPHINIKPEPNRTPGVQKKEEEGDPKRGVAENTSVHWYDNLLPDSCEEVLELSGKLLFLFKLLEQTKQLKEKVLVFSQNLLTLDLIEEFLSKPKYGDWIPALDYYRLDGSTSAEIRTANMTEFNKSGNDRLRLFLISTRAGSLGVNLVAANRVVIFDACWNPSHDLQALFRAYRYGQEKPVFVYRLLAQGTMEEKIYDRQVTKQSLSMRVVDEKQIGRHYSSSDLAELFTYTPPSPPPPPGANLAKPYERPDEDLVLCEILNELQPDWVTSYHEHDSLLEHIDDEELSEEERKAAMDQYKQQMAIESAKYNMEALQNRLDISAPEGSSGGAAANITIPPSAVIPPGISKVKTVRDLTDQAIIHVQQIKYRDSRLREMKRQYTNSPMIPRQISNDITSLEAGLKQGYALLADTIKRVNVALEDFVKSPLSSHQPFMIEVNKKRQMLYNDLESLNVTRANYAPYAQPRSQPHPLPAQPHPLSVSSQLHQNSPPLFKSAEEVSSTTR